VHAHVLVDQQGELFEVAGVDAAEVGVLQLLDRLDVEQLLQRAAQRLGPLALDLERQALVDAERVARQRAARTHVLGTHAVLLLARRSARVSSRAGSRSQRHDTLARTRSPTR
jgi:hypothetical protein